MPYLANSWANNKHFTKFCVEFRLAYVARSDEEMGFASNYQVFARAFHDGDWRHTEGLNEASPVFWADAEWGDDDEDVVGIHKLTGTTPHERPTPGQAMAKLSNGTHPSMPCSTKDPKVQKLRVKLVTDAYHLPLAVARKVKRQEIESKPKAREAVDIEFNKLATQSHPDGKGNGVWDIKTVREKRDVRWEANKIGVVVLFAMIAKLFPEGIRT